jgi:hypothetical protein
MRADPLPEPDVDTQYHAFFPLVFLLACGLSGSLRSILIKQVLIRSATGFYYAGISGIPGISKRRYLGGYRK